MGEFFSKLLSTLITVTVAVGVSASIWVGANMIFNQVKRRWPLFSSLATGLSAGFVTLLLSGNRVTRYSGPGDGLLGDLLYLLWLPVVVALAAGVVGFLLGTIDDPPRRILIGTVGLGSLGVLVAAMTRASFFPDLEPVPLVAWPLIGVVVAGGLALARRRPPVGPVLTGAALGWVIGAWGMPDLGNDGTRWWTFVAMAVPPALIGARLGLARVPDIAGRSRIDHRSRAVIFIGPALVFIFAMLVVPALLTVVISFQDRKTENYVGLANYRSIFTDPKSIDLENWSSMFSSRLFVLAVVLLAAFVVLGIRGHRRTGRLVELGSPSMAPLVGGGLLLVFAAFSTLRGTIVNNLWWVVVVTLFSTSIGLAIAVLADGARFERVAKSVIFMPMAISLVGASVIWRFMYVARDTSKSQTGVMNGLWVGLGQLSTGLGIASTTFVFLVLFGGFLYVANQISKRRWPRAALGATVTAALAWTLPSVWSALGPDGTRVLVGALLTCGFVGLLAAVARSLAAGDPGRAAVPGVAAVLLGWFLLRYWAILGTGVGGHRVDDDGVVTSGQAINFVQEIPFNNVWLMVVLIWIQTGFAMVILSAAIKAVPTELIEAARVDGATRSQVFWRVTLPQISTTIGVVVTTLIVLVMKVYDIVKVMTNGNFDTEVLANNMFREAFLNLDSGLGAALAVLILVSVLPIMVLNIRRMQREA
ncbi:MAG: carbohydrate ABC transporter permease [Ilumatobacteraceae bacterium]